MTTRVKGRNEESRQAGDLRSCGPRTYLQSAQPAHGSEGVVDRRRLRVANLVAFRRSDDEHLG